MLENARVKGQSPIRQGTEWRGPRIPGLGTKLNDGLQYHSLDRTVASFDIHSWRSRGDGAGHARIQTEKHFAKQRSGGHKSTDSFGPRSFIGSQKLPKLT